MKPHFYKVNNSLQESFTVHHLRSQNFGRVWHYHPELELHFTIRGNGLRFIGDNVSRFDAGEVLFLGENLPHSWRCQEEYYDGDPEASIEAIVIQFRPDCMGKDLLSLPETYLLPALFEKAKMGMVIEGEARKQIIRLMLDAVDAEGMDRLIILLNLLKILAGTREYTAITSAYAFYKSNETETLRLNKIYNYTLAHFKENITLEEVASIRNLTVTSFCRYFKTMTNKSYYDFLIEIRISHACRVLIEDRLPIDLLCYECGFNNISNFYRHFKKVTGMTPLDYKRKFMRSEKAV